MLADQMKEIAEPILKQRNEKQYQLDLKYSRILYEKLLLLIKKAANKGETNIYVRADKCFFWHYVSNEEVRLAARYLAEDGFYCEVGYYYSTIYVSWKK